MLAVYSHLRAGAKALGGLALRLVLIGLIAVTVIALLLPFAYGAAWVAVSAPEGSAGALQTFALLVGGLAIRFGIVFALVLAVVAVLLPVVYGIEGARSLSLRAAGFERVAGLTWRRRTYYTLTHAWLRQRAELMRIGLDDVAARVLRRVDRVFLPPEGTTLVAGAPMFALVRGNRTFEIPAPAAGTVRRVNRALCVSADAVVRDPYRRGWLLELEPADGQTSGWLTGEKARAWFAAESQRLAAALEHATGVVAADGGELVVPIDTAIDDEQFALLARDFLGASSPPWPAAA